MMDKYRSRPPRGRSRSRSEERRGRVESEREDKGGEGAQYGLIGGRAGKGVAGNIGPPELAATLGEAEGLGAPTYEAAGPSSSVASLFRESRIRIAG